MTRVVAGLLGLLLSLGAGADEWSVSPRLDARLELDDNRRLTVDDPLSTVGTVVDLAAVLGWRTPASSATVTPRVRVNRYNKEQDLLNSEDFYLDLGAQSSTERARYGLNGALEFSTVDTSETIQNEEGLAIGRRTVQADRNSWRLRPFWSYVLTERNSLSVDANLSSVDYEEVQGGGGYVDYRFYVVNTSLAHALTERDTVSGIVYFSNYSRDLLDATTTSIGLQVGYERRLTETLTAYLAVGAVRSEFNSDPVQLLQIGPGGLTVVEIDSDSTDWGQLVNARLAQKLYEGEWSLEASRDLSPTSDGVLVTRTALRAGYSHRWTERLNGRLGLSAYQDESSSGRVRVSDRTYARFDAGLSYRLTPYWTLTGQYNYRYEKYDTQDDAADSNALWVTLSWQGDKWAMSR